MSVSKNDNLDTTLKDIGKVLLLVSILTSHNCCSMDLNPSSRSSCWLLV